MKAIPTESLTKATLVILVEGMREAGALPEGLIRDARRHDLHASCVRLSKELRELDVRIHRTRSYPKRSPLVKRYNRQLATFKRKWNQLQQHDKEAHHAQ